ncbi:MAG: hypothetical protein E6H89_09985 [Chloroflexi bacterium]|nr:MAG: hypothetical protein E6H89_09985 [Chloroflexota bacterium]
MWHGDAPFVARTRRRPRRRERRSPPAGCSAVAPPREPRSAERPRASPFGWRHRRAQTRRPARWPATPPRPGR